MATQVTRSLSEIELRIKAIDKQLKSASRETASLDRALKLDPKNLELSAAKAKSLSEQMNIAQQRVALLKQRQA
jgi:phage-related minor tail protein